MLTIHTIIAREILDCRGIPTLEVSLWLNNGISVTSSIPTSTNTGKNEAQELRDHDPARYNGLGVLKAVDLINRVIGPKLKGLDPSRQGDIDQFLLSLDGTPDKHKLGSNTIYALSQIACKAGAAAYNLPVYRYVSLKYRLNGDGLAIPTPVFNVINGGKHGAGNLDFQEFLLIPSSRFPFSQSLQIGVEIYAELERQLIAKNAIHSVGADGGFAPNLFTNLDALEIIMQAINNTTHQYGHDVFLGLDVAANTFFHNGKYSIKDRSQAFKTKEFIEYYKDLNDDYHIFSLEDPLSDEDQEGWAAITAEIGGKVVIVGDDFLTTNKQKLIQAVTNRACTSILVKPNQIGSLTETVEVIKIARDAGWTIFVSNRSGETTDTFIADFAVGIGADYCKFGAPCRGERVIKYNRLLRIESELQAKNI